VTALYDVSLREAAEGPLGTVEVHWVSPGSGEPADVSRQVSMSDVERSDADASPWLRADVTAARLAEALRTATRQGLDAIAADAQQAAGSWKSAPSRIRPPPPDAPPPCADPSDPFRTQDPRGAGWLRSGGI